jgi:hypothetical protein
VLEQRALQFLLSTSPGRSRLLGRNGVDGKERWLTTRCFATSRGPLRRKPFNLATSFIILWELVQGTHSGIFASEGITLIQLPFGFSSRVIPKLNIRVAVATKGSSSDSMSYPYITDNGIEMDSLRREPENQESVPSEGQHNSLECVHRSVIIKLLRSFK